MKHILRAVPGHPILGGMRMNRRGLSFGEKFKRGYQRYDRFMEKQGFYVLLGICVLVIVLSGLYTMHLRQTLENPALSEQQQQAIQSVGSSQGQQTLREAQALIASKGAQATDPILLPTMSPFSFLQPVAGFVARSFSLEEPQYFAQSSTWQTHPALDLEADYGAVVSACAAGVVADINDGSPLGLTVVVKHGEGYESLYAGLSNAAYVKRGDSVAAGQTLGHLGNGVLFEADTKPHLHLEVRKDGELIDPLPLFLGVEK